LIFPLQITCIAALAILILVPLVAKARGKRPGRVFAWCLLLTAIGFVPSCASVMYVLDGFRFGVFHYPTFEDVRDFRVERYLPPPARDITINKYSQGYVARFSIGQDELDRWFDDCWNKYADRSATKRGEVVSPLKSPPAKFDAGLKIAPGSYSGDWVEYVGPSARNGAGFVIWYNSDSSIAYQRGGYW
jgi:hypothetical protein